MKLNNEAEDAVYCAAYWTVLGAVRKTVEKETRQ